MSETLGIYCLDIWVVALSSGPLQSFVQIKPLGLKWARPGDRIFYIGLDRVNMNKNSCMKPKCLALDIWYVASSSRHILNLSNCVLVAKIAPCGGLHL